MGAINGRLHLCIGWPRPKKRASSGSVLSGRGTLPGATAQRQRQLISNIETDGLARLSSRKLLDTSFLPRWRLSSLIDLSTDTIYFNQLNLRNRLLAFLQTFTIIYLLVFNLIPLLDLKIILNKYKSFLLHGEACLPGGSKYCIHSMLLSYCD